MKRPPWNERRRRIDMALLFCAGVVLWLLVKGDDSSIANAAINACFLLAGSLLAVYTGASVIDDRNVMQHMGVDAYQDEERIG